MVTGDEKWFHFDNSKHENTEWIPNSPQRKQQNITFLEKCYWSVFDVKWKLNYESTKSGEAVILVCYSHWRQSLSNAIE